MVRDATLDRALAALDWWATEGGDGAPTSGLTGSGAVELLETEIARLTRQRVGIAVGSGTGALLAAMVTAGVQPGDEVVMPAYDWSASASAARMLGAIPRFADIDECGGISPASVEAVLERCERPRVIVCTHLLGHLADVASVRTVARSRSIVIIEDCAQALGASARGVAAGEAGDIGCFSFGPGKLVDAGEGGMVVASRDDLVRRLRLAATHPLRQHLDGIANPEPWAAVGRIHPIAAIMACHGLAHLTDLLAERRAAVRDLLVRVEGATSVEPPRIRTGSEPSWHRLACMTVGDIGLDDALDELDALGLACGQGPLQHPAGLLTGGLPPQSADRHRRSVVLELMP